MSLNPTALGIAVMPETKPSLMGFGVRLSDMRRLERSERGPSCWGDSGTTIAIRAFSP